MVCMDWFSTRKCYINGLVRNDINTARELASHVDDAVEIVNDAAKKGVIPHELQTEERLADIANYIFQGEFKDSYEEDTFQKMREVSQQLILDNNIPLNCEECQQNQKGKE